MSILTKQALAESLRKLLQNKPLNQITIKDITSDCGVNRQTFYYHFQDVYDLLFWTMEKGIRECFEGGEIPLERPMEVVRTIFTFFKENERAVRHAYDPINRIQYETLIKQNIEPMVRLLFLSCERAQELPEDDLSFLVSFYTYSLGGFFIRWIEEGMPDEFHAQLDKFFILMNNSIPLLIDKFLNP